MKVPVVVLVLVVLTAKSALGDQTPCLDDVPRSVDGIDINGHALSISDTDRLLPQDSSYKFSIDQEALRRAVRELKITTVKEMILWGIDSHYQGIQRVSRNSKDYLVLSGLTAFPRPVPQLIIARVFHRDGISKKPGSALSRESSAPEIQVVKTIGIDSKYPHPGGIQLLGNLLLVGVQLHGRGPSEVLVFDLSDPENPEQLPLRIDRPQKGASAVGWTKILKGKYRDHYLIAVIGESYQGVDFYLSRGETVGDFTLDPYDLDRATGNPNGGFLELSTKDLLAQTDVFGARDLSYQNISLISQCDGSLFLLGTVSDRGLAIDMSPLLSRGEKMVLDLDHLLGEHPEVRDVPVPNDNWVDAFRVDFSFLNGSLETRFGISHLRRITMLPSKFSYDYERRYPIDEIFKTNLFNVNFDAATGFYIDAAGQLFVYSTKYYTTPRSGKDPVERIEFDEFAPVR